MIRICLLRFTIVLFLLFSFLPSAPSTVEVYDLRSFTHPTYTRIVVDIGKLREYSSAELREPDRIFVDIYQARLNPILHGKSYDAKCEYLKEIRIAQKNQTTVRVVAELDFSKIERYQIFPLFDPFRVVIDIYPKETAIASGEASAAKTPEPSKEGYSMIRQLGLGVRTVVVDPGHGGQDPGAIGRGGTREKDVTLAIARRLARAINAEEGMRAVLIRDGDYFISLRGRIRKAREHGADMFISVHADSVLDRKVSGSSVYVLSLRGASDEASRWLAERENAADLMGGVSLDDKNDVLASVLLDVTQKEAVSNSVEAADAVLKSLRRVGPVHGSRVRHAGFVVLKSPDIPSMLVETAFISNAGDERKLRDAAYQQRVAEAIHGGVRDFFYDKPPPGTKLAAIVAAQRGGGSTQTLAGR